MTSGFARATVDVGPSSEPTASRRTTIAKGLVVLGLGSLGWYAHLQGWLPQLFDASERPELVGEAEAAADPNLATGQPTDDLQRQPPATVAAGTEDQLPALVSDIPVRLTCTPTGILWEVGEAVEPATLVIDFGDGTVVQTQDRTEPFFGVHRFAAPGHYTMSMGVLGGDGHLGSATCEIDVPEQFAGT
ncbi:MAG: hypothetical protein R2705_07400 [Ilumatobacteraceae bacterium]